jgi:uncharacterized protein (DUF1684 family)
MVTLNGPLETYPKDTHWKVTARYTIQIASKDHVECVRVRGYVGPATVVMHFSQAEFERLFAPVKKKRKAR